MAGKFAKGRGQARAYRSGPGDQVTLRSGRDKPLRQRHPWVFSGAIDVIGDAAKDGAVADVVSAERQFLARGVVNRASQIVVRALSFDKDEKIDGAFWESR